MKASTGVAAPLQCRSRFSPAWRFCVKRRLSAAATASYEAVSVSAVRL
jgi:hypothetical protein